MAKVKIKIHPKQILDVVRVVIVSLDLKGSVVTINKYGCKLLGYSEKEIIGKNWFEHFTPRSIATKLKKYSKKLLVGKIKPVKYHENPVVTKSGKERLIGWYNTLLKDEKGNIIGHLSLGEDITEKNKAKEALKESEEKFRNLMEFSPLSIQGYGTDGTVHYWNKASEKIYGYTAKEAVGKKLSDLIIPPDIMPLYKKALQIGKKAKKSGEFAPAGEVRLLKNDGSFVDAYSIHTIVKNEGKEPEMFCIDIDLAERKKAESVLKENEQRYRVLYESTSDAIMTLEPPAWMFTSGNPATVKMFVCKDEKDFVRRGPWQYSPPKQFDGKMSGLKAKAVIIKAMKEGSNFFEWTHRRATGEDFPATVLLTRVTIGDKTFLQATVRDVTEEKVAENELRKKVEQMEFMGKLNIKRHKKMLAMEKEIKKLSALLKKKK